jgi:hypothetical protein
MVKCKLCEHDVEVLVNSHIIPSFVGKWLKDSSITGFLRQAANANRRKQDLIKLPLLCKRCELELSVNEKEFREKIFIPYVTKELDEWAVAKGRIEKFNYDKWLTDFILGLQWKALHTHPPISNLNYIDQRTCLLYEEKIQSILEKWKRYLLRESKYFGNSRHYIIFLQNLASGSGTLPDGISEHVNAYLIRSVDTTLAISQRSLFLYTKLGPILIVSSIYPSKLTKLGHALIKKKGSVLTAQHLNNPHLNEFIFITRPNEAFKNYKISLKQQKKIDVDTIQKFSKAKSLQSIFITRSDKMMMKMKK